MHSAQHATTRPVVSIVDVLPDELLVCVGRAALLSSPAQLAALEASCRRWLSTLRQADVECWEVVALERFPRLKSIVAHGGTDAPTFRTLYRNQLQAEKPTADPRMSIDEFIFTFELLCRGQVRESWTGKLTLNEPGPGWTLGRLWTSQPAWVSQWDAAHFNEIFTGEFATQQTPAELCAQLKMRVLATRRWHTVLIYEAACEERTDMLKVLFAPKTNYPAPSNDDETGLCVDLQLNRPAEETDAEGNLVAEEDVSDTGTLDFYFYDGDTHVFDADALVRYVRQCLPTPWPDVPGGTRSQM